MKTIEQHNIDVKAKRDAEQQEWIDRNKNGVECPKCGSELFTGDVGVPFHVGCSNSSCNFEASQDFHVGLISVKKED